MTVSGLSVSVAGSSNQGKEKLQNHQLRRVPLKPDKARKEGATYGGVIVANIKSAKKRVLVTRTKTARNKAIRSGVKTEIKKVYAAIESGDKSAAEEALKSATKKMAMAGSKGVYHDNTVSRKVSRMAQAVSKMD